MCELLVQSLRKVLFEHAVVNYMVLSVELL